MAKGIHNADRLLDAARDVPPAACPALDMLAGQLNDTQARIEEVTARIGEMQGEDELARRLATMPGVARSHPAHLQPPPPTVVAFRSARDCAARLGRISKAGNRYLRRLLHLGAMARIGARRGRREVPAGQAPDRLDRMLACKPVKGVAIALANRMARTIRALIRRGDSYRTAAA